MTIRLVDKEWAREVADAVAEGAGAIRLISPFIKAGALRRLLSPKSTSLQVITRFNLQDIAEGVSDIACFACCWMRARACAASKPVEALCLRVETRDRDLGQLDRGRLERKPRAGDERRVRGDTLKPREDVEGS